MNVQAKAFTIRAHTTHETYTTQTQVHTNTKRTNTIQTITTRLISWRPDPAIGLDRLRCGVIRSSPALARETEACVLEADAGESERQVEERDQDVRGNS